jgi:hypothetical protein
VAYDILTAKTTTSVCTICSAAIAINTNYTRSGYDGRHIACHDGLQAAIQAAATAYIAKAQAASTKAKTKVAIPTDAEQRALYNTAKKTGALDLVVKAGRTKAAPQAEPEAPAKAPAKKAAPKASDAQATWDQRAKRAKTALDLGRITKEDYTEALAKLGTRPAAVKA